LFTTLFNFKHTIAEVDVLVKNEKLKKIDALITLSPVVVPISRSDFNISACGISEEMPKSAI